MNADAAAARSSLFISYRRDDSPDTVKVIHERLQRRLPRWGIFYDHKSLPLGAPFPEHLRDNVTSAKAVLVIIGPNWLELLKRRVGALDHAREEVRLALQSGASVIPVLVGKATMPKEADLADFPDLRPLLERNGRPVRPDPDFDADLEAILAYIEQLDASVAVGATLAGKYTLTAELGQGGMGIVYAAQQKQPVQRFVAVKLIKPGMDSRDILARFDAERQALAVMDHPNIARVLDAGMAASGRPFFVMEYVKGVPITQYCDEKRMTPRERIVLFISVANAIQHAHQKGIIHRDIKPSNVLVESVDGKPIPKVIDFGLAKALGHKLTEHTLHTAFETRVGTLEYSSPEQAAGRSFDVDTRSDIYSLGILLYELLTGAPPFTRAELLKIGEVEMRRLIKDVEPIKPSKKLSSSGELPAIAAKRHLEPAHLTRLVQGDLDWIVMKCLEKEPGGRYRAASDVSEELQRFLADEPVQAGPPSARYRVRKFLRRHRGPVLAAALVLLSLVGGIIGTSLALVSAKQARDAEALQREAAQDNEKKAHQATESAQRALDAEARQRGIAQINEVKAHRAAKAAQQALDSEERASQKALAAAKAENQARDAAERAAAAEAQAKNEAIVAANRLLAIERRNEDLLGEVLRLNRELAKLDTTFKPNDLPKRFTPNPPSKKIDGVVEKVEAGLVQINLGSNSGLAIDQTLDVYRLQPPLYVGMFRVAKVGPVRSEGYAISVGNTMATVREGDRVTSQLVER